MTHPTSYEARPINNLPSQPTSFIGRETEIAEIVNLLANPDCRLLTLGGPGGIGKTRLALVVAEQLLASDYSNDFADGIYFVPLQPLTSAENILSAIASAIGFQFFGGGDPEEQLLDYFREKEMLLLLDNFEHLLDGVEIVESILAYATDVHVLATSREPLKLAREWRYEVRGMRFPEQDNADLGQYDAVQLFVGRARQIRYNFSLEQEWAGVLRVCQMVGGMPLALELTASWLNTLSPEQIAAEITHSLDILTTDLRDVEQRHHSIRAVFDTTWVRLSTAERDAFMKLSVFRGGCTRGAAEQVADVNIRTLMALVDKSLVRVGLDGRYILHELVRQYAAEKLDDCPTIKRATLGRHCDYYAELLHSQLEQVVVGDQREMLPDIDNLRLAWQSALDRIKLKAIQLMAEGFHYLYALRGSISLRVQEGIEYFTKAAAVLAMPDPHGLQGIVYGQVICYQGVIWYPENRRIGWELILTSIELLRRLEGPKDQLSSALAHGVFYGAIKEWAEALRCGEESIALAKEINEGWRVALYRCFMGWRSLMNGYIEEAQVYFQESFESYRLPNSVWGLGCVATRTGNLAAASQYMQEASALFRAAENLADTAATLWEQGLIAFLQEDYEKAERLYEESYAMAQNFGYAACMAHNIGAQSTLFWMQGQPAKAKQKAEDNLAINYVGDDSTGIVGALVVLSIIAAGVGEYDEAASYCYKAIRISRDYDANKFHQEVNFCETIWGVANLIAQTGQPQRAVALISLTVSRQSSWWGGQERKPLYAQLQQGLEAELGPETYAAAWAHGQTLDLETTFNELLQEFSPEEDIEVLPPNETLVELLTDREMEVLRLLADGLSNREIAEELTVVVGTVKAHVYNICQKLGASNRTQAVAKARSLRLL